MNIEEFSRQWIASWNSHDLDRIMDHYAESIDFTSPKIVKLFALEDGRIKDRSILREYFAKGLEAYPDLHFELYYVLEGVNSVVLYYRSVNNALAAEYMALNADGRIIEVKAHYKEVHI